jgi:hypothetical protein
MSERLTEEAVKLIELAGRYAWLMAQRHQRFRDSVMQAQAARERERNLYHRPAALSKVLGDKGER